MVRETAEWAVRYAGHLAGACKVPCVVLGVQERTFTGKMYCQTCGRCDYVNTHRYGCFEAQRWDDKYIYYCSAGLIFTATVLPDDLGRPAVGIIAGPIIMGDLDDFIPMFSMAPGEISNLSTSAVRDLSEIMAKVFCKRQPEEPSQERLLNDFYGVKDSMGENKAYPMGLEKQLQSAIVNGDKDLSKKLINQLLGYIFFCSNADFEIIKTRVLELVVLLSRSAIDGGADIDQIFMLSSNYVREIESFQNLEHLNIWLIGIIDRYIGYVFEFKDVKHTDVLHKVMDYIKTNYREKITLDDVANYAYLSKSYLSKIFKEEMDCTLTAYINKVRVEKSKQLLLDERISLADIAGQVGFEDQSYFTKVFKKVTGISPGKFKRIKERR